MNSRAVPGMALAVLFSLFFILILAMGIPEVPIVSPVTTSAGDALWKGRTLEVVLQGIMILSAVMSIILLLGPGRLRGGGS